MTAADVIQQTQHKMGVTVEKLRDDFTRIRTGRASTGLLDKIRVDYYGPSIRLLRWAWAMRIP